MRVLLLANPSAGQHDRGKLDSLLHVMRAQGHDVVERAAKDTRWQAALEGVELVAVAGGDGTVGRAAKALAGMALPLAVLPMGTANNIARTLGLADYSLEALVRGWSRAPRRRMNIGVATGPWGERRFIESVGAGLFAWTLPEADVSRTMKHLERSDARVSYALQMLKERLAGTPTMRIRASLDGEDVSGEYVLFEAMNTCYVGPNLYLAPDGDPGDERIDLVVAGKDDCNALGAYLESWQGGWDRPPLLQRHRGRVLRVEWDDFDLHIDDEVWPDPESTPAYDPTVIEVCAPGPSVTVLLAPGVSEASALPRSRPRAAARPA